MPLTGENYVYYERGAQAKYEPWISLHKKGILSTEKINHIFESLSTLDRYKEAGRNLINIGLVEQGKEKALIERATGIKVNSGEDIMDFIESFNEILMGKKQLQKAIDRLNEALKKENQGRNNRAPTIASFFTSYLTTALNKNITDFYRTFEKEIKNSDYRLWEEQLDSIVDQSIKDALKSMLTIKGGEAVALYGDKEDWAEVYDAFMSIEGFQDDFIRMIKEKIDFSKLKSILQESTLKMKNKKKTGLRTALESEKYLNFVSGKKMRSIGGSVQEYVAAALNNLGLSAQISDTGTKVFTNEKMVIDDVTVFSYSNLIDTEGIAQRIVNQLDESLIGTDSLRETARRMEDYQKQYLSKLDDTFIIYGSTKSYALTDSFREFSGTKNRSMKDLPDILNAAGYAYNTSFLQLVYNTGDGAILYNQRDEISEEIKAALMSSIAQLLFDDWTTIGTETGGAQAIHTLQLEGINIPLSVFLIAAGHAMEDTASNMEQFIRIKVYLPGEIKYRDKCEGDKDQIYAMWEEQRQIAEEQSRFSISFLANFKTLIKEWIKF